MTKKQEILVTSQDMAKFITSNLEGKKVKDLSVEEREYLKNTISGFYLKQDDNLKIGRNKVTFKFKNGLSVLGWIVEDEEGSYCEWEGDAVIYNPGK